LEKILRIADAPEIAGAAPEQAVGLGAGRTVLHVAPEDPGKTSGPGLITRGSVIKETCGLDRPAGQPLRSGLALFSDFGWELSDLRSDIIGVSSVAGGGCYWRRADAAQDKRTALSIQKSKVRASGAHFLTKSQSARLQMQSNKTLFWTGVSWARRRIVNGCPMY
jgi:hypothetical protein